MKKIIYKHIVRTHDCGKETVYINGKETKLKFSQVKLQYDISIFPSNHPDQCTLQEWGVSNNAEA